MWARFRRIIKEKSLTNLGKVLPVLMSEAVKCGRDLAGLFIRKFDKFGQGFASVNE